MPNTVDECHFVTIGIGPGSVTSCLAWHSVSTFHPQVGDRRKKRGGMGIWDMG